MGPLLKVDMMSVYHFRYECVTKFACVGKVIL